MNDDAHSIRTAPQGQAILWRPTERAAPEEDARSTPVYIRQRALAALHDHLRSATGQGILGFLVGDLCSDPGTQERWLEVSLVVRLTQAIYGDKTTLVISRVWERLEQEISRTGGHMLGWYHSHPAGNVDLEANDLEAHEQYFPHAWQAALVIGSSPERGFLGAFYRPAGQPLGVRGILPFYEIVDAESITAEGKKRTRVTWKNYKPDTRRHSGGIAGMTGLLQAIKPSDMVAPPPQPPPTPVPAAPPAPPPPPPPPRAAAPPAVPPPPAGFSTDPQLTASGRRPAIAPSAGAPSVSGRQRAIPDVRPPRASSAGRRAFAPMLQERKSRWPLVLTLLVLLGGAAAAYWYVVRPRLAQRGETAATTPPPRWRGPRATTGDSASASVAAPARDSAAPAPAPATGPSSAIVVPVVDPMQQFDRVTDSLAAALRRYQDRSRRFDQGNRDCAGLGRSLVAVDEQWLVYSSERRGLSAPLDAPRVGRDLEMYAQVDSVQGHFDRSGCNRP